MCMGCQFLKISLKKYFFCIMKELQINTPTPEISNYNMRGTTVAKMSSDLTY